MLINGSVFKFGDNIDTDIILPGRYLDITDQKELGKHCMEGIETKFSDRVKIKECGIIVAGNNFGCGSSREHAVFALKGAKVLAVIAVSFARIFYRNSINNGLPVLESPEAFKSTEEGDNISIDFKNGLITNKTKNIEIKIKKYPKFIEEIFLAGGLLQYIKK